MSYSYAVTHSQSCDCPRRKLAKQPRSSTTPIATKRLLPSRNLRPQPLQNTHSTRICQILKGICDALRPCDPFATHWSNGLACSTAEHRGMAEQGCLEAHKRNIDDIATLQSDNTVQRACAADVRPATVANSTPVCFVILLMPLAARAQSVRTTSLTS